MASQLRSRRKKTFNRDTSNNVNELLKSSSTSNDSSSTSVLKTPRPSDKQEETLLNVRRSSRKPKPKRHDDDEQPLPETYTTTATTAVQDAEQNAQLVSHAEQSTSTGVKVRRETRKTFQNYLETLGYNADFSKRPFKSEHQQYQENEHIDTSKKVKPVKPSNTKQELPDVENLKCQVRASSRTPKPKKKFSLVDDTYIVGSSKPQQSTAQTGKRIEDVVAKILKQKTVEHRKPKKMEWKTKKKDVAKSEKVASSNKNDGYVSNFSPSDDSSQARVSKRARVPKRRFSLIDDDAAAAMEGDDTKQQQILTAQQIKQEKCDVDENAVQNQSNLVIKRSGTKRKRIQNRDNQPSGIETEAVPPKIARNARRGKANETKDQISIKQEIPDEKTKQNGRKVKGKNVKTGTKNGTNDKNPVEEHIVLKLSIPHDSSKQNEKDVVQHHKHHHHHHHHHKHKKDKKHNAGSKEKSSESQMDSNDLDDEVSVVKGKQKKGKFKQARSQKMVTSESSTSDSTHAPHVKLVIKKSPFKSKDVRMTSEVVTSAMPEAENIPDSEKLSKKKNKMKQDRRIAKRTEKLTLKPNQKKKVGKKEIKAKTVSAYSLFTKSKRKTLTKMEPELDFAGISRRLAEMWKDLSLEDRESWRQKAISVRSPYKSTRKVQTLATTSYKKKEVEVSPANSAVDVLDMAAHLKLLGESLCSIGICLKRQDQMEVHGSLSVLLDTALCSVVPLFFLTSQLPEMAGCSSQVQAQILDNIAYIIPGL